jgi:hypothetical protein
MTRTFGAARRTSATKWGGGIEHVLTVVKDQQQLAVA